MIKLENKNIKIFRSVKEIIINSNIILLNNDIDENIIQDDNLKFNLLQNSFIPNNYFSKSNIIIINNNLIVNNFLKAYKENNIILKNKIKNIDLFEFIKINILLSTINYLHHLKINQYFS